MNKDISSVYSKFSLKNKSGRYGGKGEKVMEWRKISREILEIYTMNKACRIDRLQGFMVSQKERFNTDEKSMESALKESSFDS